MSEGRIYLGDGASGAVFSEDRAHRFSLWRRWEADSTIDRMVLFVGLNPSTADESADDPTIRRCIGFAKRWGMGGMIMGNIFSLRSTDPKGLRDACPVLPENEAALRQLSAAAALTLCAWGSHGTYLSQGTLAKVMLRQSAKVLWHLGLTKNYQPKHPLYLKSDTPRQRWEQCPQ